MKKWFIAVALSAGFATTASAALISVTNNTYATVDAASVNRTFSVGPGLGPINSVGFYLDFSKCDGQNPTQAQAEVGCIAGGTPFFNEIHFRLTSAAGTVRELIPAGTYNSGTTGDRFQMFFTELSAPVIAGPLPSSGTFRPVDSFSALSGEDPNGNWTLLVEDTVFADSLQYFRGTLCIGTGNDRVTSCGPSAVPEPAMLSLLGLGMFAFGMARRRPKVS